MKKIDPEALWLDLGGSGGRGTLVDAAWFDYLVWQKWWCSHGYAVRETSRRFVGGKKHVFMHRIIMDAPPGIQVDHINGDKLDNRVANLRLCTNAENTRNAKLRSTNKSGYKGVCFDKKAGKWKAEITLDYKCMFLGYFDTPEEAHAAYCVASKQYHGEFGRTK